ncbi:hypothetical protein [Adhaeretor mobilis]|uniref:Uncharacterized protein n=1 Tax=Adhaeretor mobilis TaxID=1930276 RepID=A0A517MRB8_9BACT|nr:hypothetical protein [Adhaeretor mobilis]QDS97433.1 hypothetical protein HG15A2_06940 [Adhaeretor mobilis]
MFRTLDAVHQVQPYRGTESDIGRPGTSVLLKSRKSFTLAEKEGAAALRSANVAKPRV